MVLRGRPLLLIPVNDPRRNEPVANRHRHSQVFRGCALSGKLRFGDSFQEEVLRGAVKQQESRERLFPRIEGVPDRDGSVGLGVGHAHLDDDPLAIHDIAQVFWFDSGEAFVCNRVPGGFRLILRESRCFLYP